VQRFPRNGLIPSDVAEEIRTSISLQFAKAEPIDVLLAKLSQ
jgi:type III secretory pathway lipoprotein EscJ